MSTDRKPPDFTAAPLQVKMRGRASFSFYSKGQLVKKVTLEGPARLLHEAPPEPEKPQDEPKEG
jgi:hypothetical protein